MASRGHFPGPCQFVNFISLTTYEALQAKYTGLCLPLKQLKSSESPHVLAALSAKPPAHRQICGLFIRFLTFLSKRHLI